MSIKIPSPAAAAYINSRAARSEFTRGRTSYSSQRASSTKVAYTAICVMMSPVRAYSTSHIPGLIMGREWNTGAYPITRAGSVKRWCTGQNVCGPSGREGEMGIIRNLEGANRGHIRVDRQSRGRDAGWKCCVGNYGR